ncbi:hypothetical protein [Pedobacter lusitanus]|uniref:hypothetical protein n=1 Tax=Pedobacter lusitanus TaxID=1503925 RepID=UPI000697DC53|nr:hypothetical protein [Pedobacter lusitanus]
MGYFKILPFLLLSLFSFNTSAQQKSSSYIKDQKTGCRIVDENNSPEISITWTGACKDNFAEGYGILTWYTLHKESTKYVGMLHKGELNGKGKFTFPDTQFSLEGNFVNGIMEGKGRTTFATGLKMDGTFSDGRFFILDEPYLSKLKNNKTSLTDSTAIYINEGTQNPLFYYSLLPEGSVKSTLVLLPSSGELVENVINCNKQLIQLATRQNILVIVPSINHDRGMDDDQLALNFLNTVFKEVITKYTAPSDKFVLSGFSNGGMIALRYTELARENRSRTTIVPCAVLGVDPPVDIAELYNSSRRDLAMNEGRAGLTPAKQNGLREAKFIVDFYDKTYGGPPEKYPEQYSKRSIFSRSQRDGGNAKYLIDVPVRICSDPDILWAIKERNRDYFDMNAASLSAMINILKLQGNQRAEFVPAIGKGYRLDGTRHPHSWSIADPQDCIQWIKEVTR